MCLSLHIQMSSSKKAGIDGECAWPQHRRGAPMVASMIEIQDH